MPIRVLSDAFAARIAAGEVIERPASVVKELVENSLDSGATRITVSVTRGGLNEIHVVDNGSGIAADEIELAFARFTTSKTDEGSDLDGIRSLGFRGEALPSIASVSFVETLSRSAGEQTGTRIELQTGRVTRRAAVAAPPGTTIRVSRLFQNVPARLKFIASPSAEQARIQQLINSYALVYPKVAFTLSADGENRLSTPGTGDRVAVVSAVYGTAAARAMLVISHDASDTVMVDGLTSSPMFTRGNRNYITLAVNSRLIQSRKFAFAVEQAYHGFLPERRFPVTIANIVVPFSDVDVNVHPAKTEVRFLSDDRVFSAIQRAVRATLSENSPVQTMSVPASSSPGAVTPTVASNALYLAPPPAFVSQMPSELPADDQIGGRARATESPAADRTPPVVFEQASQPQRRVMPVLRVIGQAHETYIIAEGPDGVYLIDQHAAHERVMYDEIKRRLKSGEADRQELLAPEVIEANAETIAAATAARETLTSMGFAIEPFGPRSLLLRGVPRLLASAGIIGSPGTWLLRVLDEAAEHSRTDSWQDRLVSTIACHASVRAGQTMSIDEARALVVQLEHTAQPHTCPHGRPTMVHLPKGKLARQFGRT